MEITLRAVTKAFGREVVLQDLDRTLPTGSRTVLLGPNGSGKSTLLQLIAGAVLPTRGEVIHRLGTGTIADGEVYRHVSIAAPYLNLYEELSLRRAIELHHRLKPLQPGLDAPAVARAAYLEHALDKPIAQFSSGMKQRARLALAILSDTPLLLLDEPTGNLDAEGIAWFTRLVADHVRNRTLVVASNAQPQEHALCDQRIEVLNFKPPARAARDGMTPPLGGS
jgi:ABC-type multidrug transport system ATPase subunit